MSALTVPAAAVLVSSWQQDTLRHIVFSEIKISEWLLFQNPDRSYLCCT